MSMASTLFQHLLGEAFTQLPASVQALHRVRGRAAYRGRVCIQRGTHPLARLCAIIAGLPPAMADAPLQFTLDAKPGREVWARDFDGHRMQSTLRAHHGLLGERLGPVHFRFRLHVDQGTIHWRVVQVRLFGLLPLPLPLFSGVQSREREQDGRYAFEVDARLPLLGLLIRYEGWLEAA